MDNTKINTWELVSLTSIITFTPLLVTLPRSAGKAFGTGVLLHALYISFIILFFFLLVFKVYKGQENKDIFDIAENVGGKPLKVITGIIVILYLLLACFVTINEFSEDINKVLLINTNFQYISILFIIGMCIAAMFGLKGVVRIGSILFPIIILGLIAIFFSLLEDIDILNLTPILGTGASKIFIEGLNHFGRYNSLFLIFIFAPKITNLKKSGLCCVLSTSLIIFFLIFLIFSIIPYPQVLENSFAFFEITRMISYGRFFQRVEVIFTFLWLFVSLIYLTLIIAIVISSFRKVFSIEYPNLLLPAIAFLFIGILLLLPINNFLLITRDFLYEYISPFIVFIYPFILLLLSRLKLGRSKDRFREEKFIINPSCLLSHLYTLLFWLLLH